MIVFKRLRRTSESNTEIYRGIHYNIYSPWIGITMGYKGK